MDEELRQSRDRAHRQLGQLVGVLEQMRGQLARVEARQKITEEIGSEVGRKAARAVTRGATNARAAIEKTYQFADDVQAFIERGKDAFDVLLGKAKAKRVQPAGRR